MRLILAIIAACLLAGCGGTGDDKPEFAAKPLRHPAERPAP